MCVIDPLSVTKAISRIGSHSGGTAAGRLRKCGRAAWPRGSGCGAAASSVASRAVAGDVSARPAGGPATGRPAGAVTAARSEALGAKTP